VPLPPLGRLELGVLFLAIGFFLDFHAAPPRTQAFLGLSCLELEPIRFRAFASHTSLPL
jgi:hypothetical protein